MDVANRNTLNLPQVKMGAFVELIKTTFSSRMAKCERVARGESVKDLATMERPILGIGLSGIGKTEIMRTMLIKNFGLSPASVVEMRLGSMQDTDITGLPAYKEIVDADGNTTKTTVFAPHHSLPRKGTHPDFGVLILDEITTCAVETRTIALQLMDSSRSIGDYKLPDGWMIVALGNGPDDGADYEELKSTLFSRCAGFYIHPDFKTWYEWASQSGIHDAVLGFLRKGNGRYLYDDSARGEYDTQITNPRTWEITSDMIKVVEAASENNVIPDGLVQAVCCSGIGEKVGTQFEMFYRYKKELIPMDEIMSGQAIKKYDKLNISLEAMYLGQNSIVRAILEVGERNKALTDSCRTDWYNLQQKQNWDTMPDSDVAILKNCMEFILWYSDVNLEWSLSTIEAIATTSTFAHNSIHYYTCLINTKFRAVCPAFGEFIKQNSALAKAMQFS